MPAPSSEDDLKRRARRRLIGAVALTLAAVIVLPLLLENEPPPAGRLEVHMPLVAGASKVTEATLTLPAEPGIALPEVHGVKPLEPIAKAPEPELPHTKTVHQTPPAQKPKAVIPPELKKPAKPNAVIKTESKSVHVPGATATTTTFVVQLGAFSDAAKTAALKNRAADLGLSSYTDKSGALTRVRVGPFPSRQAAIDAAVKLAEAGMNGQVMPK
jgi:DedD protein